MPGETHRWRGLTVPRFSSYLGSMAKQPPPKPLTEEERLELIRKWDAPSPNPQFRGATPADLARALVTNPAVRKRIAERRSTADE